MMTRTNPAPFSQPLTRRAIMGGMLAVPFLPRRGLSETAAWPRRFDHALGSVELAAPARRVVSLGYTTHDTLLALGVIPLAVRYWYGDQPFATWPWAADRLMGAEPVVLTGESGLETIAALQPDLIVGIGSGIAQAEYDILSRIAPVLMHDPGAPVYGMAWDRLVTLLARATGKEAEGAALIEDLQSRFQAMRKRHPEWAGMTAVAAYHFNGETGIYSQYDGRGQFLLNLGFSLPEVLSEAGEAFYMALSPEDLSALDHDLLLWVLSSDNFADVARLPMRKTLKAHREGREVLAADLTASALSFGSVLSLGYALDQLEADIAAATDGDPATPVASAVAAGLAP